MIFQYRQRPQKAAVNVAREQNMIIRWYFFIFIYSTKSVIEEPCLLQMANFEAKRWVSISSGKLFEECEIKLINKSVTSHSHFSKRAILKHKMRICDMLGSCFCSASWLDLGQAIDELELTGLLVFLAASDKWRIRVCSVQTEESKKN